MLVSHGQGFDFSAVKLRQKLLLLLCATLITLSLMGCQALFGPPQYSVKRVSDGDTLTVTDARGIDIKVRFACVDAPEKKQALGQKSKQNLERLVTEAGDRVSLDVVDEDQYQRKVALVRIKQGIGTRLLQLEQIKAGLAWPYAQFASKCPVWKDVEDAAQTAKRKHIGIWSKRNPLPPWEFRRRQRQEEVLSRLRLSQ